jgi:transglutaminase-like putative cysteine protease
MKYIVWAGFCLIIGSVFAAKKDNQSPQKFRLERSYSVKNKSATEVFRIRVFIPDVISYQNTKVLSATYNIQPSERKTLANGMEQMDFDLEMTPGEEKIIHLQWDIQLEGFSALEQAGRQPLTAEDRQHYLQAGKFFESDHPELVATTSKVTAEKTTELEKAQAIFDFVRTHVKYQRFGADTKGALYALQNKKGDCTEYSALIVAMSRAAGIPARLNGVMALKTDSGKAGTDNHNHAEIYLAEYGWVPAEATFKSLSLGGMVNFEIILRKGLWTDKGNGWFAWKVSSKFSKLQEIKMLGHKWQKLD